MARLISGGAPTYNAAEQAHNFFREHALDTNAFTWGCHVKGGELIWDLIRKAGS